MTALCSNRAAAAAIRTTRRRTACATRSTASATITTCLPSIPTARWWTRVCRRRASTTRLCRRARRWSGFKARRGTSGWRRRGRGRRASPPPRPSRSFPTRLRSTSTSRRPTASRCASTASTAPAAASPGTSTRRWKPIRSRRPRPFACASSILRQTIQSLMLVIIYLFLDNLSSHNNMCFSCDFVYRLFDDWKCDDAEFHQHHGRSCRHV